METESNNNGGNMGATASKMTTNTEYLVELIKDLNKNEFEREEVLGLGEQAHVLSPYLSTMKYAGLIEKIKRGKYRKTDILLTKSTQELVQMCRNWVTDSRRTAPDRDSSKRGSTEPSEIEVDTWEVLDQLDIEKLLDVLAAKFNVLVGSNLPLKIDNDRLREQVTMKENQVKNLELKIQRMEDNQRILNAENERMKALFHTNKEKRTVLAKPVHANTGTAVFRQHEGERSTLKVFRKIKEKV